MHEEQFWKLIEQSRDEAGKKLGLSPAMDPRLPDASTEEIFIQCLQSHLTALPLDQLVEFRNRFDERLIESYRWDLWAIAYIIHHGCSDDFFDSFRTWAICQGREFYSIILRSPNYVAQRATPGMSLIYESTGYLPYEIFEEKSGQDLPGSRIYVNREPVGVRWEEHDLAKLYPEECKKFSFVAS